MAPSIGPRSSLSSPGSRFRGSGDKNRVILKLGEESSAGGQETDDAEGFGPKGKFMRPFAVDKTSPIFPTTGSVADETKSETELFADFRTLLQRLEVQYVGEMIVLYEENRLLKSEMAKAIGTSSSEICKMFGLSTGESEMPGEDGCGSNGSMNPRMDMSAALSDIRASPFLDQDETTATQRAMAGATASTRHTMLAHETPPPALTPTQMPPPPQGMDLKQAQTEKGLMPKASGPQVPPVPMEGPQVVPSHKSSGLQDSQEEPPEPMVGQRHSDGRFSEDASTMAANIIDKIDAEIRAQHGKKRDCASVLESDMYEILMGMLIIANSMVMAIEFEYQGYVVGHSLDYRRMQGAPEQVWAHAESIFYTINLVFTSIFAVDILLRLTFLRLRFFRLMFNWLDMVVVISSVIEVLFQDAMPVDTVFMRMLRLGKVARAMRVIKHSEGMSSLILLLKCVRASFNTLCWSLSFIVVLQCMAGMVMSQVLWPYMRDETIDIEERKQVFRYYGTFTSTFLTMFEVLLANWAPPARILVDNVSDLFVYVFVVYRCVVGFAVLNVVSAVFIQQTMKVAQADQELILKQRLRSEQSYAAKMRAFFDKLDTNHKGYLTWKEFSEVLRKPELRSWMATLELETYDLVNLFHMIDDGDGAITVAEFLDGAIRLRGVAKSLDLAQVLNTTRRVDAKIEAVLMAMQKMSQENVEVLKKTAFGKMSKLTQRRLSLHRHTPEKPKGLTASIMAGMFRTDSDPGSSQVPGEPSA